MKTTLPKQGTDHGYSKPRTSEWSQSNRGDLGSNIKRGLSPILYLNWISFSPTLWHPTTCPNYGG
jgi:hypothetical protein